MKIERFQHKDDGYTRFIKPEPCKHPDTKLNSETKFYECEECGEKKLLRIWRY